MAILSRAQLALEQFGEDQIDAVQRLEYEAWRGAVRHYASLSLRIALGTKSASQRSDVDRRLTPVLTRA